jgi:hypothetical protein
LNSDRVSHWHFPYGGSQTTNESNRRHLRWGEQLNCGNPICKTLRTPDRGLPQMVAQKAVAHLYFPKKKNI